MSVISFVSSKGGSGKTTLNSILATYLFDKTGSVCFIETDDQKSTAQQRKIDKYIYDSENPTYLKKVAANIKKYKKPYFDIISTGSVKYKDVKKVINECKSKYQYVILDFPGSLTLSDDIQYLITELDYIFIPVYCLNNDFYSSLEFSENIERLKSLGKIKADYYTFLNRYSDHKDQDLWTSRLKTIMKRKIPFIDNYLFEGACISKYSTVLKPFLGAKRHYEAQKKFFERILKIVK